MKKSRILIGFSWQFVVSQQMYDRLRYLELCVHNNNNNHFHKIIKLFKNVLLINLHTSLVHSTAGLRYNSLYGFRPEEEQYSTTRSSEDQSHLCPPG